ncbi:MAG: right-handed parallel beta-helix repeat-containing protein [Gemmataceae bacterium]
MFARTLRKLFGFENTHAQRERLRQRFRPRMLLLEERAVPAVLWVDNAPGMAGTQFTSTGGTQPASVTGLTPGVSIFSTVSAAVTAANPNDTINVSDGTYAENVSVNKQLLIRGNKFGLDARTRLTANETVMDGTGLGSLFDISASNVVIDGFTVQGQTFFFPGAAISMEPGTAGTVIQNDIVQNNVVGIFAANNSAANQTVITKNLFRDNQTPGAASGHDIYADQFTAGFGAQNVLIDNNTFTNTAFNIDRWAVGISNTDFTNSFKNWTISNNVINNYGRGIYFYSTDNSTISKNTFTAPTNYAVGLFSGDDNISIQNNVVNNGFRGIWIGDDYSVDNSNITITFNSFTGGSWGVLIDAGSFTPGTINAMCNTFSGHSTAGVENDDPNVVNAEKNFWGNATGPTNAGNPGGTGDAVIGNVDYRPWATDASCTTFAFGAPGSAVLLTDPCEPSSMALFITGTSGDDHIEVKSKGNSGMVEVKIDSPGGVHSTFTFDGGTFVRIVVYGQDGNDDINIQNKVPQLAWLFGGNGNDHIKTGDGDSLLVGDAGDDKLEAGKGRDILIGGVGKDDLKGSDQDDILIGGFTDYDSDLMALCALTMEWSRTNETYNQRVANLQGSLANGTPPNGTYVAPYHLTLATVHDDGVEDKLDGGAGMDWFFASLTGPGKDKITGQKSGEIVTGI